MLCPRSGRYPCTLVIIKKGLPTLCSPTTSRHFSPSADVQCGGSAFLGYPDLRLARGKSSLLGINLGAPSQCRLSQVQKHAFGRFATMTGSTECVRLYLTSSAALDPSDRSVNPRFTSLLFQVKAGDDLNLWTVPPVTTRSFPCVSIWK